MINVSDEINSFVLKSIDKDPSPLFDLHEPLTEIQNNITSLGKASKKSAIHIDSLNDQINDKNKIIKKLETELSITNKDVIELAKRIVSMLDQLENIQRYAVQSQNEALLNNLTSISKLIKKDLREVHFEEIATVGEIFDSTIHDCIDVVEDSSKIKYEITDVVKRGYKLNSKIVRIASVIATK